MYLWKLIREWLWLEREKEVIEEVGEKTIKEQITKEIKWIKFWVSQLYNGTCSLLFVYNLKKYHISQKEYGIRVETGTDCEDKFVSSLVSHYLWPWEFYWDMWETDRFNHTFRDKPYEIVSRILHSKYYERDDEKVKQLIKKLNSLWGEYLEFLIRKEEYEKEEEEERIKGLRHKQDIF